MDQSAGGKLHDRNAEESWALLEDVALYDNESWNNPWDFAKPFKAISLPQDDPSTSELNKITSSCEIFSGPHDTQYCKISQAFVDYASSHTDEAGEFIYTKGDDVDMIFIDIIKKNGDSHKEEPKVENFTYVIDFMIVEDTSSIIDRLRLSQVVLGKPSVEISNMTHDPPKGAVRFTNEIDEIAYKMPHKIKQYNSLLDLEREHTKSVYLMNKEDKRRGVEYVMRKLLGFYKNV
uniref:MAK10-like protein n=1 Tax=Tanacetum cinerariifolium TaxID=118510 RepID=A0A6L2N9C0_TANCI|nr:MAK10-like protein [Tanacetum cinerariifolium]